MGEPNTTSGQPLPVRSNNCVFDWRYVEPSAPPSYVTISIFTSGCAFWYACTDGSRVESAHTVIFEPSFCATGVNAVPEVDVLVVVSALAQPARAAAAARESAAAAVRSAVRRLRALGDPEDLIVVPFLLVRGTGYAPDGGAGCGGGPDE
ncbi:hypothetical protein CU044_6815 [Streptomyces sp. L-9-10]|nr:hypothetical protein CU044_6815 [Streptomyces sp. L-9-10]